MLNTYDYVVRTKWKYNIYVDRVKIYIKITNKITVVFEGNHKYFHIYV